MPTLHVTSEIGPLRAVLVHTPGNELLAVTPGTREDYLYDDIIDIEIARREHRRLVALLERFARVYEVRDMLSDILERQDVREYLITRTMDIVQSDSVRRKFHDLPPEDLVTLMIEGMEEEAGPIGKALNEVGYALPPVPNLFFTRDVGIVIGGHVVIGSMRHTARWSEELIIKSLFMYHPELRNAGILYDGSEERRTGYSVEGGDVHPLRPDTLILGFSDRSSPVALDYLCDLVFSATEITDIVVVVLPSERAAIHLDMVFTQVDHERCAVYPPHFVGPERLPVLHRRKGQDVVREMPDFFTALREVGMPLEPVLCGGNHRPVQEREQWASACNFVTVRPGVAIAYKRNDATLAEFERAGYRIIDAVSFLTGQSTLEDDERAILATEGAELVRGGGGPRCMTLPLLRDDP
ncbi:MAG TPA: arginine deiminase family protein [Gemmatimonadales bacterium]